MPWLHFWELLFNASKNVQAKIRPFFWFCETHSTQARFSPYCTLNFDEQLIQLASFPSAQKNLQGSYRSYKYIPPQVSLPPTQFCIPPKYDADTA